MNTLYTSCLPDPGLGGDSKQIAVPELFHILFEYCRHAESVFSEPTLGMGIFTVVTGVAGRPRDVHRDNARPQGRAEPWATEFRNIQFVLSCQKLFPHRNAVAVYPLAVVVDGLSHHRCVKIHSTHYEI